MASNYLANGLKRSALAVALGLCFIGGVQAQSNTAGSVIGRAASGDTITITNPATGFTRTVTVDASGTYRFSQLPTGDYQVTRNGEGARGARVSVGGATSIDFVSASGDATTLGGVTVIGSGNINPIDVSSVESSTILTAEQIRHIPVATNTTAVALLAPGTVRGDSRFGNLASFGGSSVAENQYYVNGFNVTNTFNNLSFTQVPFEAISEQQVKTGGYGAEFGRSTGGVINQIIKRGTNEFHAGAALQWSPESLQSSSDNFYQHDGVLRSDVSQNRTDTDWLATVWASGALVQDRLFAYGLIQYGKTDSTGFPGGISAFPGNNTTQHQKRPQWLLKLDWNITDDHILEFTGMSDKRDYTTDYYTGTYSTATGHQRGAFLGTGYDERGGSAYVLKYTGYLTDNFTLSALYGYGKNYRSNYNVTANGTVNEFSGNVNGPVPGCPLIQDLRPGAGSAFAPMIGCALGSLGRPDAGDTRNQFRIDAEWVIGDHQLRFGIDTDRFRSKDGFAYSGGHLIRYYADDYGVDYSVANGADVGVNQRAYYIEDSWNVTDNFVAYIGLRWDSFENINGLGETFVEIKNQFAPRLGLSWDVFGDSSFKVFANAGRYALPVTATAAVRGASASVYTYQVFYYAGVDPITNAPLNRVDATPVIYVNNEFGAPKNASSVSALNLKPMYQDEWILGFQKELTEHFSLGMRAIHRNLKAAIDDTCDYRAVMAWAIDNGFEIGPNGGEQGFDPAHPNAISHQNPGFTNCRLYNPGQEGIYNMDVNGDGVFETVNIPAFYKITPRTVLDYNGNPVTTYAMTATDETWQRGIRKYTAIEFFFEGHWDRFFLQGSYTYARNYGNTEGGVKSDNGQDDTGTTQDFDYPELSLGAAGYLPNDRRHTLKMFGAWDITEEWRLGANILLQSGRPYGCLGVYENDPAGYRASYFSCDNGAPLPGTRNNGSTIVPRGSVGRTPWNHTLDLGITYSPNWAKGLSVKLDIFNVFNTQVAARVNEGGENSRGVPINGTYSTAYNYDSYLLPTSYTAPRSVQFTLRYEF